MAVKKVTAKGAARNGKGYLQLTAPDNLKLKDVFEKGLIVPEKLDDNEAHVPLDFTTASSRIVGQQYSHWSVRYSYLVYLVGLIDAELGNLKHDLKAAEAAWRRANLQNFKAKYHADDAMWRNKKIKQLREKIAGLEATSTRYNGLLESYKALREAASREITRRTQERAPKD